MPHRRALLWLAFALPLFGCGERTSLAHLIRVSSIEQIWERPSQLNLRGEGFPAGMRGEALLVGTLYAPGARPEPQQLRVPCRALSSTQAVVDLLVPAVVALPEGPFSGSLEVRFGTQSEARLMGRLDYAVFRLSAGQTPLPAQFALGRRALSFQRSLGITLLELGEQGPVVSELAAGSTGQRAGLAVGDTIVRMDGAPVQLPVDVLGRGDLTLIEVEVRHAHQGEIRALRIGRRSPASQMTLELWALCFGLGAGLAALAVRARDPQPWSKLSRREFWLSCLSALCVSVASVLVLEGATPHVRDAGHACLLGGLFGGCCVYLMRRIRRTLWTTRDPALTPFL